MTADESRRAAELFEAALDRDPADRAAFLDQACGENRALHAEVEALLAADAKAEGFLESPIRPSSEIFRQMALVASA